MKFKTLFLLSLFGVGLLILIQGCGSAGSEDTVVAGEVINSSNGDPIPQAVVQITSPQEFATSTATNEEGAFSFGLNLNESADITLRASKPGFTATTPDPFTVSPETDVTDLSIELTQEGTGGGDGDPDQGVGGDAGGPASIILESLERSSIAVRGTGGEEHSAFTFVVRDSAGRSVDERYPVDFNIIRGPGGGESIDPPSGFTNPENGQIKAAVASGDLSGAVRIEAVIDRQDVGLTIRSTPVLISIANGFPEDNIFNVGPRVYNFDAFGFIDESHTNPITASVGDQMGNPVKEGTAVYFSASNGGLVNGSATTNANGYATVNLSANGSQPTGHSNGTGYIDVVAETVDRNNNYIEETVTLLLTTPEAIINLNPGPGSLNVPNGGSQTFDVEITDLNGYPMAAGTQITVEPGEGLTANGSIVSLELGDYFNPGPGRTQFSVTLSDEDADEDQSTNASFTITVEAPSGTVTTQDVTGSRAKNSAP